jgi:hypothetical protein
MPDNKKPSKRNRAPRTAVIVLGMHRTGSSALTRVLSLLGCDLPANLIPARENDNGLGFWESQSVIDVNQAILESAGSNWNDWTPLGPNWLASPLKDSYVERAHAVLADEFGDSRLFVLKDPRLCRLMPVWSEALTDFGATPVFVLPVRNPFEVSASLRQRNQLLEAEAQLCWLRHVLDSEQSTRGQARVFVRFVDLLENWRRTVDRISATLDLPWPHRSASVEDAIDAFLSPNLRHQKVDDGRVLDDSRLSPWIKECYQILCRWTRDDASKGDEVELDRIRRALNNSVPAFDRIVLATRELGEKRREQERNLANLRRKLSEAETSGAETEKRIKAIEAELAAAKESGAQGERRCQNLAGRLEAAEKARQEDKAAQEALRARLEEAEGALKSESESAAKLRTELAAAKESGAEAERKRQNLAGRLEAAEKARQEDKAAQEALRARLEEAEGAFRAEQEKVEALGRQAMAAQRERSRLEEALQSTREELDLVQNRLMETESALAQRRAEAEETAALLARTRKDLEAVEADRASKQEQVHLLKQALTSERESATDRIRAVKDKSAAKLAERDQALAVSQAELERLERRLEGAEDALANVRVQLRTEREGARETLRGVAEETAARLAERDAALARARREAEAERSRFDEVLKTTTRDAEAARIKHDQEIEAAKAEIERLQGRLAEADDARKAQERQSEELRLAASNELEIFRKKTEAKLDEHSRTIIAARQEAEETKKRYEQDLAARVAEIVEISREAKSAGDKLAMFAQLAHNVLHDYISAVHKEIRYPGSKLLSRIDPVKRYRLAKAAKRLRNSAFFDPDWYLEQNQDVASLGLEPARHFIEFGFEEGRAPSAQFEENK